ncbi:MAG: thiol-disulfide oxidoreductase DCC family protein [Candidatus Bathyarchaeia archaeon]
MIQKPRVVYDGICNLCTGAVRFLNLIDRSRTIEYKPYQELGLRVRRKYGMSDREFQGRMHLIRGDDSLVSGPAAITEVCKLLAPFKLVCSLFNTSFAARVYNFIAARRYSLFGCRESCFVVRE